MLLPSPVAGENWLASWLMSAVLLSSENDATYALLVSLHFLWTANSLKFTALFFAFDMFPSKLQALVYNILPPTTAIFSYAIGPRKLSANKQFFVGSQTVVSLLQTTQIISDVCFITDHAGYPSSNKTQIGWIKMKLFFLYLGYGARVGYFAPSHVYVPAWALGCFHSFISTQTFRKVLTTSADSCMEITSAPSVA